MKARKTVIALMFLTPVLLVAFVVVSARKPVRHIASDQVQYPTNLLILLDKWEKADFVAITDTPEFHTQVREITVLNDNLTEAQKHQLYESVSHFLQAYHDGDFESYRRFRIPTDNFWMTQGVRDFLKTELGTLPADAHAQFKLYWSSAPRNLYSFVQGASLRDAKIDVISTNNLLASLGFLVQTQENVGVVTAGPSVEFKATPTRILKDKSKITYATLVVTLKNSDKAYPVYCRYYWDPETTAWLPDEIVTAYSGPREFTITF